MMFVAITQQNLFLAILFAWLVFSTAFYVLLLDSGCCDAMLYDALTSFQFFTFISSYFQFMTSME